jgi:hypothetical protein
MRLNRPIVSNHHYYLFNDMLSDSFISLHSTPMKEAVYFRSIVARGESF